MKRVIAIFFLCLCFLLGYSFYLGAGAVETDLERIENADSRELEVSSSDVLLLDSGPLGLSRDGDSYSSSDSLGELTGVRLMSVAPVEPADDGSLKSVFLSLIGSYDPVVLEYQYTSSQGYVSYLREVQLDYPWLASALLFIVVLWCVFKVGGRILWNK